MKLAAVRHLVITATRDEADKLLATCAPHLAALARFALATGCRAREIAGLEWNRVDLGRHTACLNQTKNGTPRGVPLNQDAVKVLEEQIGKHPQFCFTYRGKPIKRELTNTGWHKALGRAGLTDLRFHDLRHTWASWHRQAGTSCDELKELGGWKSRRWWIATPSTRLSTWRQQQRGLKMVVAVTLCSFHVSVTLKIKPPERRLISH